MIQSTKRILITFGALATVLLVTITALAQVAPATEVATSTVATTTETTLAATTTAATSTPAEAAAATIAALEDKYFRQTRSYLQVLPNNQLPQYESGTVLEKLGERIPDNASVTVYESPRGLGYQIIFTDGNTIYSFGYGPEWADRTYSHVIPTSQASSTAVTVQ